MRHYRAVGVTCLALAAVLLLASGAWAQAKTLEALVKQTGLKFTPLEGAEDSWVFPFETEGDDTLNVYVTYNDEKKRFALLFSTVVDKEDNYVYGREVLAAAMQLSNDYPGMKFVLDGENGDIDCQAEVLMDTITAESLTMYINLVASMADDNAAELNRIAGGGANVKDGPAVVAGPGDATEISWQTSLDQARAAARAQNKPILIDFYATWCGPCKMLDEQTYKASGVISLVSQHFIPVKIDVDKQQAVSQQFNIEAMPTTILLDARGKEIARKVGFIDAAEMMQLLGRATPDNIGG